MQQNHVSILKKIKSQLMLRSQWMSTCAMLVHPFSAAMINIDSPFASMLSTLALLFRRSCVEFRLFVFTALCKAKHLLAPPPQCLPHDI